MVNQLNFEGKYKQFTLNMNKSMTKSLHNHDYSLPLPSNFSNSQ